MGDTLIPMPALLTISKLTDVAWEGSAAGIAVIVTLLGDGARAGAVYSALVSDGTLTNVPQVAPVHPAPETIHRISVPGFDPTAAVRSAALVARTVIVAHAGSDCGAVKIPSAEIVPALLLPPAAFAALHVMPVLVVFSTVALSLMESPSSTDAFAGTTLMVIAGSIVD